MKAGRSSGLLALCLLSSSLVAQAQYDYGPRNDGLAWSSEDTGATAEFEPEAEASMQQEQQGLEATSLVLGAEASTAMLAHWERGYRYSPDTHNEDGATGLWDRLADDEDGSGDSGQHHDYGGSSKSYYEGYYSQPYNEGYGSHADYVEPEYEESEDECSLDANSRPVGANGTALCDILIEGVDKLTNRLKGGLDGVYAPTGCYNGKPMYTRIGSPPDEERVLWYSITFWNWIVSRGAVPNEVEIIMYGSVMEYASLPLVVKTWFPGMDLGNDLIPGDYEELPPPELPIEVTCADGTEYSDQQSSQPSTPSGPDQAGFTEQHPSDLARFWSHLVAESSKAAWPLAALVVVSAATAPFALLIMLHYVLRPMSKGTHKQPGGVKHEGEAQPLLSKLSGCVEEGNGSYCPPVPDEACTAVPTASPPAWQLTPPQPAAREPPAFSKV